MLGLKVYNSGDAPAGSVPGVVWYPLDLAGSGIASIQWGADPFLERDGERAAAIAQNCRKMLGAGLRAGGAPGLWSLPRPQRGKEQVSGCSPEPGVPTFFPACQGAVLLRALQPHGCSLGFTFSLSLPALTSHLFLD